MVMLVNEALNMLSVGTPVREWQNTSTTSSAPLGTMPATLHRVDVAVPFVNAAAWAAPGATPRLRNRTS